MPRDGGKEEKLINAVALSNFAVSEHGIYYEGPERPSGWTLRFLNPATGHEAEIGRYTNLPYLGLSISPDRRTVLFAQIDHEGSDLMDVENIY